MRACRFCGRTGLHEFVDLGHMPPSNSFLTREQLELPETHHPLKLYVCDSCFLVQLPEYKKAVEIFGDDYVYYSSQSPANVSHAKEYVNMICERFGYGEGSQILEIGSNDGYMLQHFIDKKCSVQGVDPSDGPADEAILKGIPTVKAFFQKKRIGCFYPADLICSINTIAHQPDINDFVEAMKLRLKPGGIITAEFPYLLNLINKCQFDTIYHEHYSYFSLSVLRHIFETHGLWIFDVDELPEHGGSVRIYARHLHENDAISMLLFSLCEGEYKFRTLEYYLGFQNKIDRIKTDIVRFLVEAKQAGKLVVGYGAPAKASTFLSYCGIRPDLLPFTIDRSPHKIGKYIPGCHIPVKEEFGIKNLHPDYVLILSWNLKEEIVEQLSYIRSWGGKFVVAIPELEVL